MNRSTLARGAVVLVCAASAGIHGALTPGHFAEGTGAGIGFAVATAALAAAALAVTVRPHGMVTLAGSAALLAVLLGAYVLAVTGGVPVLHPEPSRSTGSGRHEGDRSPRPAGRLQPRLAADSVQLTHPKGT
jgi:hypothetical protein